jgi:outer membrane cobalamin receptor
MAGLRTEAARAGRGAQVSTAHRSRARGFFTRGRGCVSVAGLALCGWAAVARAQSSVPAQSEGRAAASPVRAEEHHESVVTAARLTSGAARADVAAASSVVSPADSPRARDDLGALLLEVPGANVTRQGGLGAVTTVSLRGSNPDEVRVYLDGVPLNQAVGGAVDLSTLPLGDVERVEVYRGSTPIAFGESALGGVIAISTRTPDGPAWVAGRAGAGSFQTFSGDAMGGGAVGPVRLYVGVHALDAAGDYPISVPATPGGYQPTTRENADVSQLDGVARAALSLPGRRELRLGLVGLVRSQGLPALDVYRATSARGNTARALAHLDYESREDLGASSRLRAVVFAAATRDEFWDPNHEIVGVPTATHDVTRTVGVTTNAEKALGSWGRLATLLEGRNEDYLPHNDDDPSRPAGYPANRLVGAAGAELDIRFQRARLDVLPSARLEASRDVRTGRDVFGAQLGPSAPIDRVLPVLRLGLVRTIGETLALRANVGRYARLPSFVELYGYNRGVLGNPQLVPEHGTNADLGVTSCWRTPAADWSGALTAFGALVDDLIEWQPTATQTRAENIARARVWGLESEARLRTPRLTIAAQVTLTDARDESASLANHGTQLVFHPRYHGYGRVEWRQPLPFAGLAAGVYTDVDATAGNNRAPRLGAIPAHAFVGAGLSLEHAPSGLRLVASAANLADTRAQDFQDYPLPGRSLFVTLGWSSVTRRVLPD